MCGITSTLLQFHKFDLNRHQGFLGAGALALPLIFSEGGTISTSFMLWLLAGVALYATFCLSRTADLIIRTEQRRNMVTRLRRLIDPLAARAELFSIFPGADDSYFIAEDLDVPIPSFAAIGNVALGPAGGHIVDIAMTVCQIGICIAYLIFMSGSFHEIFGGQRIMWVLITVIPSGLFILIPNLAKLSFLGLIGNFVYIITIIVVFYVGITKFCCIPESAIVWNNTAALPLVFGTCSFALEGIALVMPIKANMRNDQQFDHAITVGMAFVTCMYWMIGLGCYLLFGTSTTSPILDAIPHSFVTNIAKLAMALSIFCSFPFQFYPVTEFFQKKLNLFFQTDHDSLTQCYDYIDAQEALAHNEQLLTSHRSNDARLHTTPRSMTSTISATTSFAAAISSSLSMSSSVSAITPRNQQQEHLEQPPQSPLDPLEISPPYTTITQIEAAKYRVYQYDIIIRYINLALITFISIAFPNFKLIISLFGSFANSSLAYIFPTTFWVFVIARGTRYICQTQGESLHTLQHNSVAFQNTFFPTQVFFHDVFGHTIDIDNIMLDNQHLLEEYLQYPERFPLPQLIRRFVSTSQKAFSASDSSLLTSPKIQSYRSDVDNMRIHDDTQQDTFSGASYGSTSAADEITVVELLDDTNSQSTTNLIQTAVSPVFGPDGSIAERQPLLPTNSSQLQRLPRNKTRPYQVSECYAQRQAIPQNLTPQRYILDWLMLPMSVAIIGILASIISVIGSIQDIMDQFG